MITDEEVMRLFERADPARVDEAVPLIDAPGYLDALRTRSSDMTIIEIPPTPAGPKNRHRWPIISAVAAVVVALIAGGALVIAGQDDDTDEIPATPTTTAVAPDTGAAAEQIARGLLEAENAYDADRALTYLSDDYIAAELGTPECPCRSAKPSATRSDEIGLGPYTGDYKDFTIRHGKIVALEAHYEGLTNGFSAQMWEPFARWVAAEHPNDVLVMYEDESQTGWRITDESIPLWEQRIREYATSGAAYTEPGFIGLPPEGATPSTPENGELVDSYYVQVGDYRYAGYVRLYADGRLIWRMLRPEGVWSTSTGWLEQRLTPEGVELVRTHENPLEKNPLRLHEWLPPSAWEDQQFRAYVPFGYAACLAGVVPNSPAPQIPDLSIDQLLALLPAPAADLLAGRQTVRYLDEPVDTVPSCLALTTDDARQLDTALRDAGVEQNEHDLAYQVLTYQVNYPGQDDAQLQIVFEPLFPDGSVSCSACG